MPGELGHSASMDGFGIMGFDTALVGLLDLVVVGGHESACWVAGVDLIRPCRAG